MDNSLFRKVDKEKKKDSSKYEVYGFKRNPFPKHPGVIMNNPDDRQNGSIYLKELRTSEESQFEHILVPDGDREETKSIAFLMDYATRKGRGIGKTAFLNYQRNRIMKDLGDELSNSTEVMFAVYVAPKPNDNYRKFSSISKLIMDSIVDQEIISICICRLRVFSGLISPKVLEKVKDDFIGTIGNNEWLKNTYKQLREKNQEFEEDIDILSLNTNVKRQLESIKISPELILALHRFGYSSSDIRSYYFDKKPDFYWKKNADNLLFNDFVKIFELAGFTHGIILLEELEKVIVPQTSIGRREFCDALRYYFIDGDSSSNTQNSFYKILLTIHPYLQELLYPHWNASGLGRFAGLSEETSKDYTVYFNPIDAPSARPLAETYINESRLAKGEEDAAILPFNEESLSFALKKALGVPGKYLALLHSAIERGIDEKWTEIGIKELKTITLQDESFDDDELGELGETKVTL